MIIGIDLGTTNSLAAIWRDGQALIIPNAMGENLTPSCVGLDQDGSILVGKAARERLQTHPQLTAAVFKRYMGSERKTSLGNKEFRPEELSSLVLRAIKADAEAFLGETVTQAIITVPAYFSDAQRKATKIAGQLAGLQVDSLLNEPTAAALAYGMHDLGNESKFLVFDLGGGTFDVSILELFDGVMEVRASAGDNFLGGEDFVSVLRDAFLAQSGLKKALQGRALPPQQEQFLRDEAERGKRRLSESNSATMRMRYEECEYALDLDEDGLIKLSVSLLDRLRQPVERALRDAKIRAAELDKIVLAGGSTRMPIVRKLVSRMFGRFPSSHLNPDEVVAMGAAVQAGLKMRDAALREIVMTDVAPYSLGVEVSHMVAENNRTSGHFLPIIERNTVVPVSRVETVYTTFDNQTEIRVAIYQGEARLTKDNVFLGSIDMSIPPKKAGEVAIEVRFTYDINGILEAQANMQGDKTEHKLIIADNPGVMTPAMIAARFAELADLKIHPRDQAENRVLMARAERIYEQALGDTRSFLSHRIAVFQALLDSQAIEEIRHARPVFKKMLDDIDGESYF